MEILKGKANRQKFQKLFRDGVMGNSFSQFFFIIFHKRLINQPFFTVTIFLMDSYLVRTKAKTFNLLRAITSKLNSRFR